MVSPSDSNEQSGRGSANATDSSSHGSGHIIRPELRKLLDEEDKVVHRLQEGETNDSIDTNYRYAAYARTLKTFMGTAHRYIAYSSDIGESFRPVSHPYLVRSAYAVSWAYILGDVTIEGRKAYLHNQDYLLRHCPDLKVVSEPYHDASVQPERPGVDKEDEVAELTPWSTTRVPLSQDWRCVTAERAAFQVLASMALPAFTIHSIVKYSGRAVKNSKNVVMRTWAPIGLGLSIVPVIPFLFDQPVEHFVKTGFNSLYLAMAGPDAFSTDDSQGATIGDRRDNPGQLESESKKDI